MMGEIRFYFPDLELLWPSSHVWIELIRLDLQRNPSPFYLYPSNVPLTENFQRPPTSLLLSKQVGSSSSSRQHRMEAKPLTPAPTMATLFPMVARKEGLQRAPSEECPWILGIFSRKNQPRSVCQVPHLNTTRHRCTLASYAYYFYHFCYSKIINLASSPGYSRHPK